MRINLPIHGGIDPAQHHERSVELPLRQTRGEVRLLGFDKYGRAIPDHSTLGPTLCRTFWPGTTSKGGADGNSGNPRVGGPGNGSGMLQPARVGIMPILGPSGSGGGMWSNVIPIVGGSPVAHGHSDGASTPGGQKALGLGGVGKGAGSSPGASSDRRDWQLIDGQWVHGHWVNNKGDFGGGTWIGDRIGGSSPLNKFGIFPGDAVFRIIFPSEPGYGLQEIQNPAYRYAEAGGGGARGAGGGVAGAAGPVGGQGQFGLPGGGLPSPITGEGIRSFTAQPIKSEYQKDPAYQSKSILLPAGWPSLPQDTIAAVVAGTHQDRQADHVLHGDPRLVAVNRGPDPKSGSLVCDTNARGSYDSGHSAPLQSAFRVLAPLKCSFPTGDGPAIALQFAPSERDWLPGYGLIADISAAGTAGAAGPITPNDPAPVDGRGRKFGDGFDLRERANGRELAAAQLSLELTLGTHRQKGAGGAGAAAGTPSSAGMLTAAMMSARRGGPIEVGHGTQDKHRLGSTGDGENVNSAHVSTNACFYRDGLYDAPLLFEQMWKGADTYPGSARVHLEYDNNGVHASGGKTKAGIWKWRAEVPYETDTPVTPPYTREPKDPPPHAPPYTREPEDPPAPPQKMRVVTDPDAPGDMGHVGAGLGSLGEYHAGRGIIEGTEDLPGASKFPGLPGGEFYPEPGGLTTIRAFASGRGAGATASMMDSGQTWNRDNPSAIPMKDSMRADPSSYHPTERVHVRGVGESRFAQPLSFHQVLSSPGMVFRPQETTPNAAQIAMTPNPSRHAIANAKARSPVVAQAFAFGGMAGVEPKITTQSGKSRHASGDGPGGVIFCAPQYGFGELRDDRLPTGVTASDTYLGVLTGSFFGAGKPNFSTGGMKSGARWGVDASSGDFLVQGLSSAGVATTSARVKQSGTFGLRESGGTVLDVGAIADGEYVRRSGANLITDSAPGRLLSVTVYNTGSGNHVPNAAATAIVVRGVAGGGGGGGADPGVIGGFAAGGGGSSGGWFEQRYAGGLAGSYAYAVGGGGASGAAGAAGAAGTDTTFDSATAKGGGGGAGAVGTGAPIVAGGGAATAGGSGSPYSTPGNPGAAGIALAAGAIVGGEGGCSPFGGGAATQAANAAGNAGSGAGAGGGGGATDTVSLRAGGAGSSGLIVVFEYA